MWRYSYNLRALYATPVLADNGDTCDAYGNVKDERTIAETIIQKARQAGRTLLTEVESKQVLAAYGIPTVATQVATNAEEAVKLAEEIDYPVVLKVFSQTITHKTDVNGVHLNLHNADAVREAYNAIASSVTAKVGANSFAGVTVQPMIDLRNSYELILGSSIDAQFGPVLLFGTGGQLVEVFQDKALGLPPLNTTLARRMMEQTRIYKALQGVRGRKAVNLEALEQLLVRFSQLVVEQRLIKEIDINPLLVKAEQITQNSLIALDARILLHDLHISEAQLPKPAIRPYPTQYVDSWTTRNGMQVTIRPIRPEDEPLMIKLHHTLSEESVFFRYFHLIKLSQRIAHERLTRLCFIDYDREMALVVDYENPKTEEHELLAIGRLSKLHGTNEAEFAMLVSDRYQCQGLGTFRFALSISGIVLYGLVICLFKPGKEKPLRFLNFWIYGAIEPLTGDHFLYEYPKLDGECFQQFLDWLSVQLGSDYAILQIDQAPAHTSSAIRWPENIIPLFQPASAPELNPIERLWQLLKKPLKNQLFSSLQTLRDRIQEIFDQLTFEQVISVSSYNFILEALFYAASY